MTAASAASFDAPLSRSGGGVNPWFVAVVVSIATFMEVLDTSIANVVLPHIAGGLSVTQDEATWVLTSYLVANAIVLPISGWLSTVFGRKRFYMTCVALFSCSSFLCGMAPSLPMLIVFRVLQGAGGGGLALSEQAILTDTFPPARRGMAFAVYGIAVVVAPAVGPTLGGWITDNFSWRWIFFINVPVGLLSLFLTWQVVHDPPFVENERRNLLRRGLKIDFLGFGLISLGLASLQVVLDKGQEDDWLGSRFIQVFAVLAIFGLVCGVLWELYTKDPIVDVPLLKDPTFLSANLIMFMLGFFLFGSTVLLPLFAQTMLGYTATRAGLVITPGGFFVMACMPVVGFLTSRVAARWLVLFGLLVSAASLYHMTSFNIDINYPNLAWARVYQAAGLAFLFVPINTAAYAGLKRDKSNNASALLNLSRNMGGSVGIAFATTILARRSQFHQTTLITRFNAFNPQYTQAMRNVSHTLAVHGVGSVEATHKALGILSRSMQQQATMLSYIDAFWLLAIGALLMTPLVFCLRSNKPGEGGGMH